MILDTATGLEGDLERHLLLLLSVTARGSFGGRCFLAASIVIVLPLDVHDFESALLHDAGRLLSDLDFAILETFTVIQVKHSGLVWPSTFDILKPCRLHILLFKFLVVFGDHALEETRFNLMLMLNVLAIISVKYFPFHYNWLPDFHRQVWIVKGRNKLVTHLESKTRIRWLQHGAANYLHLHSIFALDHRLLYLALGVDVAESTLPAAKWATLI